MKSGMRSPDSGVKNENEKQSLVFDSGPRIPDSGFVETS
jgi:hypothetical protein